MRVVFALVERDEHLHFLLGVVVEGVAGGIALLVILPTFLLHFLLRAVVDHSFVYSAVVVEGVYFAFEDLVELVVEAALVDAAHFVVFQAQAALHLAFSVFDIDLYEGMVGVVYIVGAANDTVLIVDHMLEGCQAEAVVLVAGAEDDILGHGEVDLVAALPLGVVFGYEVLQLVAALEVVVEIVACFVHDGVDAFHRAVQAVVLQVVAALGRSRQRQGH